MNREREDICNINPNLKISRSWQKARDFCREKYHRYAFERKLRRAGIACGWRKLTPQIWDRFLGQHGYTPLKFKETLLENIEFTKSPSIQITFAPLIIKPEKKIVPEYSQRDWMICSLDIAGDLEKDAHLAATLQILFDPREASQKSVARIGKLMVNREYWNLNPDSPVIEEELALTFFKQYTKNIERLFKIWNVSEIVVQENPVSILIAPHLLKKYGFSEKGENLWSKTF